ncbi:MAG TPA: hypothetical protein VE779_04085 [Candidatus Angelobacter sp.]|jgi:predicted 2-oxoglutarate/Fe(II)-dependent dioxygenase YbiX|nr:hypothetical protein [Candidatus Angelobacter sp.]
MKRIAWYLSLAIATASAILAQSPEPGLTPQQVQQAKKALDTYAEVMGQAVGLQNASYRANRQAKADPALLPRAQEAQQAFLEKDREVKASAAAYLKLTAGWCAAANHEGAQQPSLGFQSDGSPRCVPSTPDYWMLLQLRSVAPAPGVVAQKP